MSAPNPTTRSGLSFTKQDRILRRGQFVAAQNRGRRVHTTHFTLILLDRGDGEAPRIGLTTSRKVGNSVRRNRVRRLLREVFRLHREEWPAGHDCVVIVRENAPDTLTFALVRDEVLAALRRRPRPGDAPRRPPPGRTDPSGRNAPATGQAPPRDPQQRRTGTP